VVADLRDEISTERDVDVDRLLSLADDRDKAAEQRDRAAEERDAAADTHEEQIGTNDPAPGNNRRQAAIDRLRGAGTGTGPPRTGPS
jgi:hypothetical protein